MSEEYRARSFDELAKGLASGNVSRRKALRLMGAALVASALGAIPRAAVAAQRCKQPSACCTCHFEDPATFQVVARKCNMLRTTDTTCNDTVEQSRLKEECNAFCQDFQQRKFPTLLVGQAAVSCNAVGTPNTQQSCQKTTEPGVSGTECANSTCTS
jgi:hypothetical protein